MSGRIRFANQLRGIAALSVAASHLIGVYWVMRDVVSITTFSPTQSGPAPAALSLVSYPWFNFGPFGVAVFFLISGFVIPFSLEKHDRLSFAIARILRIYPAYVAALLLEMAMLYAASVAWGRPFAYSPGVILTNALLVYDLVGHPSVDLVNWTLSVELKFYVLMVLLLPAIRRAQAGVLVAAGAGLFLVNGLMAAGVVGDPGAMPSSISYTASSHSVCLIFMLIGIAFNFHQRRQISAPVLLLLIGVLGILFVSAWRLSVWRDQYPFNTFNYACGLGVFGLLYACRRYIPANPVLDGLAAISFPFYAIHSILGYSVLRVLMVGYGVNYYAALAMAVMAVLLIATALHFAVERPSTRAGQRLAMLGVLGARKRQA